MRIGFFVWEYPPSLVGGLGTYAQNMAPRLVKLGYDVSVFTLNRGGLPTREVMEGVEVHRPLIMDMTKGLSLIASDGLNRWGSGLRFFSDIEVYNTLSAAKFLNELVEKEERRFDMVCYHDWLSALAGITVQHDAKLPAVFHVHSTEWGRTNGQGSDAVSRIEEAAAESADRIITVSNLMKEDLVRHAWPKGKIDVVWNGVDPSRYDPAKVKREDVAALRSSYGIAPDEKMLLFVGRLSPVKGILSLIQAMPDVVKRQPKTKLVVLASGELEREVMALVDGLGLSGSVKLRLEFVPEEQRILHYAASDLCVFPSTYEPFGIVTLEAMAMSKPVVAGARGVVGFVEQVVPHGPERCGMHVNGSDPADIAWGIDEALRDPDQAKAWGANGRRRVEQYFTWDRAASETLKVYKKAIR
ncbi:MAG: glycosyltransferase family 4 protein [Conexivisphaerales archaeon]|jgi:glycosyltransferase involved in cell wall biosynthesis